LEIGVPLALPVLVEVELEGVLHWQSQWHTMKIVFVVAKRERFGNQYDE